MLEQQSSRNAAYQTMPQPSCRPRIGDFSLRGIDIKTGKGRCVIKVIGNDAGKQVCIAPLGSQPQRHGLLTEVHACGCLNPNTHRHQRRQSSRELSADRRASGYSASLANDHPAHRFTHFTPLASSEHKNAR